MFRIRDKNGVILTDNVEITAADVASLTITLE